MMKVRRLRGEAHEIDAIAERMRLTLEEVLGEDRGRAMYTHEWLRERVRWHLEPTHAAAVFVADHEGEMVGHSMVREETEGDQIFGLFATTYVVPKVRRLGVAKILLQAGEAWMHQRGLHTSVTYTDRDNMKLIHLYETHGYGIVLRSKELHMVKLARTL